jgi:SAM-dependent MidA family methyltransferase
MEVPPRLRRSDHVSWFAHTGAAYLFHDLYGYLMEMSPDIADLIEAFAGGVDSEATIAAFAGRFDGADPRQLVEVLIAHAVLVPPGDDELAALWPFVVLKGRWNVWQRRGERLTIWTAWGDRSIQQVFLDADETRMWDAFDGEKRLVELRQNFDPERLLALVRRLVHSDVQAIKLSMMPWSTYAKRPAMAPRYLTSTMPFPAWRPGQPAPSAPSPSHYYKGVGDADVELDQQETTLSHLLRVPHPALSGRTYGQTLADVLIARGAVPEARVRVLEIGAGLGYVANDVIARLRAAGRTVEYTIVELSPALAAAQRERIRTDATWIIGDALEVGLRDAAFDLVICNEMLGDLPARQLSRTELGLALDGTGSVDRDRLRAISSLAADAGLALDDAPEPFYLQTGAFELIARIARALAPGGTAIVTEFGDANAWPRLSTHLDHPELSTHFGHLEQLARAAGLTAELEFVIDLLELDRTQRGLATTRSQFRALRALAADAGVELAKIGYTRDLLEHAVAGKLDLSTVGDLRYEPIEDRLMGLVPHEFKALVLARP